ncbi:DUF6380 family protein [Streptomyces sp. NPDC020996]|uniref:DUF6380 family protein n=1 Tax=Streptomyces sp. NPDC020996 TaxID=3154791 RepID=UPI0034046A1E
MHRPVHGDSAGENGGNDERRHATLREATASLTVPVCRDPFHHRGGRAGEDAR